jgi:hypothetical protein
MTDGRLSGATAERVRKVSRCGLKCGRMCGLGVHTWTSARPRQHWVFVGPPSQTTRPPRGRLVGWVRVVWLGVFSVRVLAGAGSHGLLMQAQAVVGWWVVGGRDLEWLG